MTSGDLQLGYSAVVSFFKYAFSYSCGS